MDDDFSRDSLADTKNILRELRGLVQGGGAGAKQYVSVRLKQGVPLVDADWNEAEDIRRLELETALASLIGNGVPAGSDSFRIRANNKVSDFAIEPGLIVFDGWLVYNPARTTYENQPRKNAITTEPSLPTGITAQYELIYLDAWEELVSSQTDPNLVDERIGIETAQRIERAWVVRRASVNQGVDPRHPGAIPNREPGHRYYPLAQVKGRVGSRPMPIIEAMITDLRRTHLTLEHLTHAPLYLYDPVRDQSLDAQRLADAFGAFLAALDDACKTDSKHGKWYETFVKAGDVMKWRIMTLLQDLRAGAITYQQQTLRNSISQAAALDMLQGFCHLQQDFIAGVGDSKPGERWNDYNTQLESLQSTIDTGSPDLLGAVLAQERINAAIGTNSEHGGSIVDGTVMLCLLSITPTEQIKQTVQYTLKLRVRSELKPVTLGEEYVRVVASADYYWQLAFKDSFESAKNEIVLKIPNGGYIETDLNIFGSTSAANTWLKLKAFPERRRLTVFRQRIPLNLGEEIIPGGTAIAALWYDEEPLEVGNILKVSRDDIFKNGIKQSFTIANLGNIPQTFELAITPDGDKLQTGWETPSSTQLTLDGLKDRAVEITFKTSNQKNASSHQTFTVKLRQIGTDGQKTDLLYTAFSITFQIDN